MMPRFFRVGAAVLLVTHGAVLVAASSCRPLAPSNEPAPCRASELSKIEAAYVAEAVAACVGYTIDTCPDLPSIDAKYDRLRLQWVNCQ